MDKRNAGVTHRLLRASLTVAATLTLLAFPAVPVEAQRGAGARQDRRVSDPPILRRNLRNILPSRARIRPDPR